MTQNYNDYTKMLPYFVPLLYHLVTKCFIYNLDLLLPKKRIYERTIIIT